MAALRRGAAAAAPGDRSERLPQTQHTPAATQFPPTHAPPAELHPRRPARLARELPVLLIFPREQRGKSRAAKRQGEGATRPLRSLRDRLPRKRGRQEALLLRLAPRR